MVKKIGFTGTQDGMTQDQMDQVKILIREVKPEEIHHGDCVGADFMFHKIVEEVESELGIKIRKVGHIPDNDSKRAFCNFDEVRPPRPYLVRNRAMADEVDLMVGTPKNFKNLVRSGTWSTIRYSKFNEIPCCTFFPDGTWSFYKMGVLSSHGGKF